MTVSSISEIIKPTLEGRLRKACKQISYLTTPMTVENSRNPYLICDIYESAHKADECNSNKPREQVCLSGGDIYDDPSLLRFYQNDDILPWGNVRQRVEGEEGPEWVVKSMFEDKFANFMLEKDLHAKGLGEMLNQQRNKMHNQFSQILATLEDCRTPTPKPDAPTFVITTRSGITTHDPPYPTPSNLTNVDDTERGIGNEGPKSEETTTMKSKKIPHLPTLYHPFKSSSVPFPYWLKKQKKDDDEENSCLSSDKFMLIYHSWRP
ncbi:hypothetical protein Tco_1085306 [Tanacetum coccineum]